MDIEQVKITLTPQIVRIILCYPSQNAIKEIRNVDIVHFEIEFTEIFSKSSISLKQISFNSNQVELRLDFLRHRTFDDC